MAKVNRPKLKSYFNTGDQPTESEFIDVFDSTLNLSGSNSLTGSLTISGSRSDNADGSLVGLHVMGDITSSGNIVALGDVIAKNYVVSSSVTNIVTLKLSGSSEFGNTADDTHVFTGDITASNNISASGTGSFSDGRFTGKVGIGTTSPANKLHIETGNIQLSTNQHITWGFGGNNAIYGNDVTKFIKIFTNGSERLIVNSSGNVGIENTAPPEKLTVTGNISASGNIIIESHITASGNISASGTGSFSDGRFAGKVGIGTTSPSEKLHIFGNVNDDVKLKIENDFSGKNANLILDSGLNGDDIIVFRENGTTRGLIIYDGSTDVLKITNDGSSGTEHLSISSSGNVGIGTFSPDEKLEVVGNISASGDIKGLTLTTPGNISGSTIEGQTLIADVFLSTPSASITNLTGTNITSSGNISASGNIFGNELNSAGSLAKLHSDGKVEARNIFTFGTNSTNGSIQNASTGGNISIEPGTASGILTLKSANTTSLIINKAHITASGNISASGTIFASRFESAGASNEVISFNDNLNITGHITASGNISGSTIEGQTLIADIFLSAPSASITNLTGTNITASGNISASRTGSFGAVSLQDNGKIFMGTSNDLQIFHDGSNSRINEGGTGNLIIQATNYQLLKGDGGEFIMQGIADAEVSLYYNGSKKFETTNTGISITGNVNTSTHITASGNISGSTIEGQILTADQFLSAPSASITNLTGTNITASGTISASGAIKAATFASSNIDSTIANLTRMLGTSIVVVTGSFTNINTANITASNFISGSTIEGQNITADVNIFTPLLMATSGSFNNINTANITSSRTASFLGMVETADKIVHSGDPDTFMRFITDDTFQINTGGQQNLLLTPTKFLVNTTADVDFQVQSAKAGDGANSLYVVGSTGNVGLGTDTAGERLTVHGNISASGRLQSFHITASGNISSSIGTGSFGSLKVDGSSVDFSGLPTSDPGVAGRLYNDSNVVKISAG